MKKVKLSIKQVGDIRVTTGKLLKDQYGMLQGRLLTTMDFAVENDRQVEGMKARIKDIQGQLWEEIRQQRERILAAIFLYDARKNVEGSSSEIEAAIPSFIQETNRMIMSKFDEFVLRLKNLMGISFSNSKLKCLMGEIDEIVRNSRGRLLNGIAGALRNKFGLEKGFHPDETAVD